MVKPPHVRRLLTGRRGVLETYLAQYYAPGFPQEKFEVRVDHYRKRSEITAYNFHQDDDARWQPGQPNISALTPEEWEQFFALIEAGFWNVPSRDHSQHCMDGELVSIEGYRQELYHEVHRHAGSLIDGTGEQTFMILRWMATRSRLRNWQEYLNKKS